MILNEFLRIKLGVDFENKYNALAVKEILENRDKYPLIAPFIADTAQNEEDMGNEWDYDCGLFECEDPDTDAGYDETMELYRAFLRAFTRDVKGKKIRVDRATFGLNYLEQPNTHDILDPTFHHVGWTHIRVTSKRTSINDVVYYPAVKGKVFLGTVSDEDYFRTFLMENNGSVLNEITKNFLSLCRSDAFFVNRFENEGLAENPIALKNGETVYPYDFYEIEVEGNVLRFFSTERGFDALSALRFPILDSLTDEQRENEAMKRIEIIA